MHTPGTDTAWKGGGEMHLQDKIGQLLSACPRDLSDVTILVRHGPGGTKDHTLDRSGAKLPLLIYGRPLGEELINTNNIGDLWSRCLLRIHRVIALNPTLART
jgi:hypothetical protein